MTDALKRLAAYLLDLILVYLAASLISSIIIMATNSEEYMNTFNNFMEMDSTYINFFKDFKEYYDDNKLDGDEYNKLIEEYDGYVIGLKEAYQDLELSQKEYNQIYDDTLEEYDDAYIQENYKLSKLTVTTTITAIILMFVYFVIIQYFTNGQTAGKKILKLRVVSNNEEHVTINSLLLRSLIITDILWSIIKVYCLYTMDAYGYNNASILLNSIMYFILFVSLLFIIYRKDRRSLQDLFAGTKVVRIGDE